MLARLPLPGRLRSAARSLALALPLLAGGTALAQTPSAPVEVAPPPRPAAPLATGLDRVVIDEIKNHSEQMVNLQYLCDVIGPRLTGSPNLDRASHWTADRMREYGLENVHLEPWEVPVGWERGRAEMRLLEPGGRPIAVASQGWSGSTKGKVTGPVVVLQARTKADLEKYKGKLKDAVVLMGAPREMQPVSDMTYFGMRPNAPLDKSAGPPQGRRAFPQAEAKKDAPKGEQPKGEQPKGEAAKGGQPPAGGRTGGFGGFGGMGFFADLNAFLKAEGVAAVLTQSIKPHGLIAVSGGWRGTDRGESQDRTPQLVCAYEHYALLWRLASDPKQTVRVELEVSNKFLPGPITCYNTVGEIKGSEKPDEFVVVGAHLDSWDLGQGATDNGTGSCVVLECARALAKLAKQGVRPKRTIRFVLYTGEEQGLHGSREYVKRHKDDLSHTSVALVHDTGTGKVKGFGLHQREAVRKVLEPELAGLAEVGFEGLSLRSLGGSDHQSFDSAGVPGFACIQEPDEYRLTHHTQSDTFDKAKAPNLIQGAQVMAVTALRIADLPALLPRERPPAPKREGKTGG